MSALPLDAAEQMAVYHHAQTTLAGLKEQAANVVQTLRGIVNLLNPLLDGRPVPDAAKYLESYPDRQAIEQLAADIAAATERMNSARAALADMGINVK